MPLAVVPSSKASVSPIRLEPHGKNYSQWAADWWQWALETSTPDNPLIDATGENCAAGQRGFVWLLAGVFGGGAVERSCTIPGKHALLFPIVNFFYAAFLSDPPETTTHNFCRESVAANLNAATDVTLTLEIDGTAVPNLERFFETSIFFKVRLPEENIFGLTEDVAPRLLLSPMCDAGYYVMLDPLPPGTHTVHWTATGAFTQDVTYHLTVVPGG